MKFMVLNPEVNLGDIETLKIFRKLHWLTVNVMVLGRRLTIVGLCV